MLGIKPRPSLSQAVSPSQVGRFGLGGELKQIPTQMWTIMHEHEKNCINEQDTNLNIKWLIPDKVASILSSLTYK